MIFSNLTHYTQVIWQLIKVDLLAYSSSRYLHDLIDSFFWTTTTLVV